jgi:hypothetical protein
VHTKKLLNSSSKGRKEKVRSFDVFLQYTQR